MFQVDSQSIGIADNSPPFKYQHTQTVDSLANLIKTETDAKGYEGYTDAVLSYMEQCSSSILAHFDQDRTAYFVVNVRHPLEAYFYRTMSTYTFKALRSIRKDHISSAIVANQAAKDVIRMCDEMVEIGRQELQKFEKALNKPAWGPTAST